MPTRLIAQFACLLMVATLAGCAGQAASPTSVQNGRPIPSPGSGYNPISGTSPQD